MPDFMTPETDYWNRMRDLQAGNQGTATMGQPFMLPPGLQFGPGPITDSLQGMGGMGGMGGADYSGSGGGSTPPTRPTVRRGADRWQMGEDGRLVDPLTGQHKISSATKASARPSTVFGGAYANGGVAPAGKVSLVGERGPELIMPTGPTRVVPMGRMPMPPPMMPMSAAPRGRAAPMITPDYSLNAPPRPVGRSMNDPSRLMDIAMRRARSQGNIAGAAQLGMQKQYFDRFQQRGMPPSMPPMQAPAMPAMPSQPGGKLVPGRSADSMVWQPDAPPVIDVPQSGAPAMPSAPPAPMPTPQDAPPLPPMLGTDPLGQPLDRTPNVPAGFGAMNASNAQRGLPLPPPGLYGPEVPPAVSMLPIPGTDYGTPVFNGQVSKQTLQMTPKQEPLPPGFVPQAAERGGVKYGPKADAAPKLPDGIQYEKDPTGQITGAVFPEFDPATGKWKLSRLDMNNDGVIDAAERAAAKAASAGGAPTLPPTQATKGGFKFSLAQ